MLQYSAQRGDKICRSSLRASFVYSCSRQQSNKTYTCAHVPHCWLLDWYCREVLNPTNIRNFLEPFYVRNDRVLVLNEANADAFLSRPMPHLAVALCTKGDPAVVPAVLANLAKLLAPEQEPPVQVCMIKGTQQELLTRLKVCWWWR